MKNSHPDIEALQIVAKGLGTLLEKVVFVGGATTTLYLDDPGAAGSVATLDIDCVVELTHHPQSPIRSVLLDQIFLSKWFYPLGACPTKKHLCHM